jgi:tetratricopeptide (TPR) repeat protein
MGRYQEGLQADREMVSLQPTSPLAWYNLACSLSLTGQANNAFQALEKAVALGYDDAEWLQEDDDFAPLRSDPRFERILARLMAAQD